MLMAFVVLVCIKIVYCIATCGCFQHKKKELEVFFYIKNMNRAKKIKIKYRKDEQGIVRQLPSKLQDIKDATIEKKCKELYYDKKTTDAFYIDFDKDTKEVWIDEKMTRTTDVGIRYPTNVCITDDMKVEIDKIAQAARKALLKERKTLDAIEVGYGFKIGMWDKFKWTVGSIALLVLALCGCYWFMISGKDYTIVKNVIKCGEVVKDTIVIPGLKKTTFKGFMNLFWDAANWLMGIFGSKVEEINGSLVVVTEKIAAINGVPTVPRIEQGPK
jgi:hypothetical protein